MSKVTGRDGRTGAHIDGMSFSSSGLGSQGVGDPEVVVRGFGDGNSGENAQD